MPTQKPQWPYTCTPYLWPSWTILAGICVMPITSIVFWIGLIACIYAHRKRGAQLAAEKRWWREFNARNASH